MSTPVVDNTLREQILVDLSLWLSRVLQYSADHPACAQLGEKTLRTVTRALSIGSPIAFGVLKDQIMVDGVPAKHPVLRTRVAPLLHARGVLVIRFHHGVTVEELTQLVSLLALPEQTIFDRGGLSRLAVERHVSRVQIEEITHEISAEERVAQQRRERFRAFFTAMLRTALSRRRPDATLAEQLIELLDHPEVAVTVLEEDAAGIAEAVAGLALIIEQEALRTGIDAKEKLIPIILLLSPGSRDRLLLGFAALTGDFRRALGKVFDIMTEPQLARLSLPSVRAHGSALEPVLYALSVAIPHDGTRLSMMRRVALFLFDVADNDSETPALLGALAADVPEYDSFRRERECLRDAAVVALERRGDLAGRPPSLPPEANPPFDGGRTIADIIEIASRTRGFERFCRKVAAAAPGLGRDGAFGALRGLAATAASHPSNEARLIASQTQFAVSAAVAPEILADLDGDSTEADEAKLANIASTVTLFAKSAPAAVLDRLDISENRVFRRILLDALPHSSADLLALLRPRLHSSKWYVARNAIVLLPRAGGTGADLVPIANHPREQVRAEIIRVLRNMLDPAAMDIIALYLTDASPDIAAQAPALLRSELLGPAAIARLEAFACDEQRREDLRRRVVLALGRCPRDEAAAALFQILQPKGLVDLGSGAIRDLAASQLRHSPAPGAQHIFEQGLKSSSFRVRKACERAVEQK